jgi:hypothetical protein
VNKHVSQGNTTFFAVQLREEAAHLELQKMLKEKAVQQASHKVLSHTASQTQPASQSSHSATTMTLMTAQSLHTLEVKLADAIAAADLAQDASFSAHQTAESLRRENAHLKTCLGTAQREAADARASAASAGTSLGEPVNCPNFIILRTFS